MMFKFIGLPMDSMRLDSKPNTKSTSNPEQQLDQHARTALANELANFENKLPAH